MLSIGKMVACSGEYYIATVANGREEYYTGSGESPGFWLGEGARRLGLEGSVDPDDLRQVLAGVSPQGEILTAGRVDEGKRGGRLRPDLVCTQIGLLTLRAV